MKRLIRGEVIAVIAGTVFAAGVALAADWPQYGGDIKNSRNQASETAISPANVGDLVVKWTFATNGSDISATPSVKDGFLYFGDWAGQVYKVNKETGMPVWSVSVTNVTSTVEHPIPDRTRHTPAVVGGLVIFGNQSGRVSFGQGGAKLVALHDSDGSPAWVTQLDSNAWSVVTASPTVVDGVAYVGVASFEEAAAGLFPVSENGPYTQTSRGSVVAVDISNGHILWQTYTAPVDFTGNSVWGSAPAVDLARNQVYVATGNNFSAPASYHACIEKAKNANQRAACNPQGNYFDSVIALKLTTGEVNWAKRVEPFDTWNVDCFPGLLGLPTQPNTAGNCPQYDKDRPDLSGPDFDFAQGPILYTASGPGMGQGADFVGVGQKSGVYWALRPSNGDVMWSTRTGPGGLAGGHQWGSASDGQRVYTSNANSMGLLNPFALPYKLADGTYTKAGIFSALDGRTGNIIWQIANPGGWPAGAPATIANGVMYVCSGDPSGYMYALDAATGAQLWSFESGTHCGAGAAVADGVVYWGTGYSELYMQEPGAGKLYAFKLPPAP